MHLLATALEAAPFTLPGDVPVPAGAPWWAHYAIAAAPVVGWYLFSSVVAELNERERKGDAEGGVPVSPRFRLVMSVLNRIAANHDKARQQAAKAKVTP